MIGRQDRWQGAVMISKSSLMGLMRKLISPCVICLSLALSVIAAEPQAADIKVFHRSGGWPIK